VILYIRTAKTASSTLNNWCGSDVDVTFNQNFLDVPPNKPQIDAAIDKGAYLFTTVRNPFTRAISCWQQSVRSNWIKKDVSFQEFLEMDFESLPTNHAITHNIPLADYLEPYMDKINNFVKVEKLEEELPKIASQFGLKKKVIGNNNASNFMKDKTLNQVYNNETKQLVLDKYSKDFEAFGYSKSIDF